MQQHSRNTRVRFPQPLRQAVGGRFKCWRPLGGGGISHAAGMARAGATVLGMLVLAGCIVSGWHTITGSGRTVTQQYPFTGFSEVSAGNAFEVVVTQASTPSLAVTVDDNLIEYLDVTMTGRRLHIGLRPNANVRNATLKAAVSVPELTALELSGACHGELQGCRTATPMTIELSGACRLEGRLASGDLALRLSGASHASLEGKAGNLRLEASGASGASLGEFEVKDASVGASGASHALVRPSGQLQARASGASSVRYTGQPASVRADSSGASSVKPE